MDKKNTFLGILFIAAGIGFMFWQAKHLEEQRRQQLIEESSRPVETGFTSPSDAAFEAPAGASAAPAEATSATNEPDALLGLLVDESAAEIPALAVPEVPAEKVILSNEFIEVEFTTAGGAIREVRFLQTKRSGLDDYVFNRDGLLPALSLSLNTGTGGMREFNSNFTIAEQTPSSIRFVRDAGNGLVIERSYQLAEPDSDVDPYVIVHRTSFGNRSDAAKPLASVYLNLGTSWPLAGNAQASYLNVGFFDGEDAEFVAINKLTGSRGFLGIGASEPTDRIERKGAIEWSSVKNQFFASVLSSKEAATAVITLPVEGKRGEGAAQFGTGITGSAAYSVGTVQPGSEAALDVELYVGPKEFKRLQSLGNQQDLVMQFGFFGFFSKLLLAFMYAIHSVVPSWGWAIVIMTICVKTLFWPLTAKASQSQKRMSKIQGPMAELKEKYKDNPQKMQQETLKLFKEHQVNPLAGCLPIFIQMPVFLGLFYMLRTASELRYEPFLWVADLSQPDTITEIAGFPINILPLIMGVTMFLQMRMMPTSPTADPVQQKIFKFMPLIFLVFLYNFASGLCVYWTMQNILTIVQQKITNSRPDPMPVAVAAAAGESKGRPKLKKPKKK